MSVEHIAIVLHHSRAKGTAKLVLIGIANHDGDAGAFPSQETLAKYANVDVRNVRKAIESLVSLGEVAVHERGGLRRMIASPRHQSNRYEILVKCPPECDRSPNHRMPDRAKSSGHKRADASVSSLQSYGTKSSSRDRTESSGGDRTESSYEPSVKPTDEPSGSVELALAPAAGSIIEPTDTAQTILGSYIDWCAANNQPVPSRVRGHLAREIKQLLVDGFDSRTVRIALAHMHEKAANPSSLASFAQHAARQSAAVAGPSRTEERVNAAMAVADRMRAREAAGQ